jgi:hypothetical protein
MSKYRRKPETVDAVQWFPGVEIEGLFTDPKQLVGQWWAHAGHQRELETGRCGIVVNEGYPVSVNHGDWIVSYDDGQRAVYSPAEFEERFEAVE